MRTNGGMQKTGFESGLRSVKETDLLNIQTTAQADTGVLLPTYGETHGRAHNELTLMWPATKAFGLFSLTLMQSEEPAASPSEAI